jgi:predicted NACHT family NTPase
MEQNLPGGSTVADRVGRSKCVLLGAPGSGKTTLMSYFAVALATGEGVDGLGLDGHHLPILVRIRDWIQSDQTGLLDYIRAFATEKLAVKELPDGFFEHWLEAGKALILLDGLDEVANEARRDEVVNQIEVFLQAQSYRDNPAIITSRPAGYKQAYFRTEEFPHYDLLPFDQPKIDAFIQNWYDNRFRDRTESERRQQTLKKALSERDRIQVLAKNPLLLTIIALIHRYEAYLPRDRHQLYNRAVETLLTNWDAGKTLTTNGPCST